MCWSRWKIRTDQYVLCGPVVIKIRKHQFEMVFKWGSIQVIGDPAYFTLGVLRKIWTFNSNWLDFYEFINVSVLIFYKLNLYMIKNYRIRLYYELNPQPHPDPFCTGSLRLKINSRQQVVKIFTEKIFFRIFCLTNFNIFKNIIFI